MDGGEGIEVSVLGGLGDIAAAERDACAGDGADNITFEGYRPTVA